ncbi:MAG TPA: NfeD family protein [Egibacteraceae bacterium]|jgi:membrane-bound serine protease (ClpP class)|nr:NfeD family protein [Egibacteraceae bacterium]
MVPRALARRLPLRAAGVVLLLAGLLLGLLSAAAGAQDPRSTVEIAEVEGPLDRPVAAFLTDVITRAEASGVDAVVITLDSPGGLRVSGGELADRIAGSAVPVVVWVGPPGAVAAGAAAVVAEAAHVLALAPGSTIGPSEPADLHDGAPSGEALTVTAEGLDVDLRAPPGARVVTESVALDEGAAAIVAPRLEDVLSELDGLTVTVRGAPRNLDIDPQAATVRFTNLGLGRRVLHGLADPSLAYVLLLGGALALAFEIFQPGFGVAGVSGMALAGFGLYGVVALPVAWWAFALVVAGLVLLAADLAIGSLGILTAAGAVALGVGSWNLFAGPDLVTLPGWLALLGVASAVVFFVPVMTMVLRAQSSQAMAGADRVVGKSGVVRSMLNPEGHVFVDGALWRARAPEAAGRVKTGTPVRVIGLNDRLTLDVELVDSPQEAAR